MSGPVTATDTSATPTRADPTAAAIQLVDGRRTDVAGLGVVRLLPKRTKRTVGAWCFADVFGPTGSDASMRVGPHPHIGLHTVTWLLSGTVLHRDSLGSEQLIRPGQLNLMTAGAGIAHAEESMPDGSPLHGAQLWIAQPDDTRAGAPDFRHHDELPDVDIDSGEATVLIGELAGARSPARTDTPLAGAELRLSGQMSVPVEPAHEHALLALIGDVVLDGVAVAPGQLAYAGPGRDALALETTGAGSATALLLGGLPFDEPVAMWWNFVARTRDELEDARRAWVDGERFGVVDSPLPRIPAPQSSWPGVG